MSGLHGVPDHLEQLFADGHITANIYHMCLVSLAHRYLCYEHDAELALITLNRVPPAYFLDVLPGQAQKDEAFAQAAVELSYKLVQFGLAFGVDTQSVNMLPASA